MKFSDDSLLTFYALLAGKTVQQPTAIGFTAMPETLSHHVRQYLRWMRGMTVRTFWRFRYLPLTRYAYWQLMIRWVQALTTIPLFLTVMVAEPVTRGTWSPQVLVVLVLVGYVRSLRYLTVRRYDEPWWSQLLTWLLAPLVAGWQYTVLRGLWWYGMATCLRTGWGTRQHGVEVALEPGVKRTLIIILVALLACGCSAHVSTRTAVTAKPDTSRFLIGAAATSEAQFRRATGVQPDIVEHYVRIGAVFSASFAAGAIPLIQLTPYDVPLASIANGGEDDWLRSYARAVARYQHPVILGFAPEMNGSWYTWGATHVSPAGYIAAWRHVVTVFRGQGALNVTWLWTVNVAITPSGNSPSNGVGPVTPWWPGAAWVDWAGVDGYFYRSPETFRIVFGNTLSQIRALTPKPVLISETAAAPAAGKAAKIPVLFAGAYAAGVAGLVWFDLPGNRDWRLDEDQAALAAFRAAVARYRNPVAPPAQHPTGTGV